MSQTLRLGVDAQGEAIALPARREGPADLEAVFTANYARICRVLARVISSHARAEELAVEAFLKWSATTKAQGDEAVGWIYRTAVRLGLDELRRGRRHERLGRLFQAAGRRSVPTPEDVRAAAEARQRVRHVLGTLRARDASLLVLHSESLSYRQMTVRHGRVRKPVWIPGDDRFTAACLGRHGADRVLEVRPPEHTCATQHGLVDRRHVARRAVGGSPRSTM